MNNLKTIREKANKTQEEISAIIGVDRKTYRSYENEGKIPSNFLIMLSDYYSTIFPYNISIDYLLGRIESPYTDVSLKEFSSKTHLSENAIGNILFEASEKGDNRYIDMLDMILSDKETFSALMSDLLSLYSPNTWVIYLDIMPEQFKVKQADGTIDKGVIQITPETLTQMDYQMPYNVYFRMRKTIETFVSKIPKGLIFTKNHYHPWQMN